jgi:preprotein translocase subunit SecE
LPEQVYFDTIYAVDKVITFLKEVSLEMSKVVWPNRQEVIKLTLIVFIISGIIGAYIGVLDLTFARFFERLLST